MAVIVTGTFVLPNGEVAANRLITLRRSQRGVVSQGSSAVLPDDVTVASDNAGQVEFDLVPGNYVGFARTASGQSATFKMAVPDVETVDVAALVDAEPVPAAPPSWYSELLARIEALEGGGAVQPEVSTVEAATDITANTLITGAA